MTQNFEKNSVKNDRVLQLIETSSEITSSTISGLAAGLLSGDPVTTIGVSVGSKLIEIGFRKIGNEILERMIGPREKIRAGAAFAFALVDVHQRTKNGEKVREDSFF